MHHCHAGKNCTTNNSQFNSSTRTLTITLQTGTNYLPFLRPGCYKEFRLADMYYIQIDKEEDCRNNSEVVNIVGKLSLFMMFV